SEDAEQHGGQPRRRHGLGAHLLERADLLDGRVWIGGADCAPECVGDAQWIARGPDDRAVDESVLCKRLVDLERRVAPEAILLHIADDADDLQPDRLVADPDALADRVFVAPVIAGERLVDDGDTPGFPVVSLFELAAADKRDTERA